MKLAETLGRQKAHDIVHTACARVLDGGESFRDALLDAPEAYTGLAAAFVDGCWPARRERPIETAPGTRRDAIDVFPFPIRRRGAYILPARLG